MNNTIRKKSGLRGTVLSMFVIGVMALVFNLNSNVYAEEWGQVTEQKGNEVASKSELQRFFGGRRAGRKARQVNTFNHKGDFSVITIGTGTPTYNPDRSGPSAMIHYKGNYFLVDMGDRTRTRLYEAGIPERDIQTLMFTHHHLDHNEDFISVFVRTFLQRRGDVKVMGPAGTEEFTDFIMKFYAEDMAYRASNVGYSIEDLEPDAKDLKSGDRFTLNGVTVSTTEVNHTITTLAYRFDADGKSIVISGDLSYSDSLVKLARGADIMVIDGGSAGRGVRSAARTPRRRTAGKRAGKTPAHSSLEEVAKMAQSAEVKTLVLTHLGSSNIDEASVISEINKTFKGTVYFGEDLKEYTP